jgi:predicted transcriptional regulator
MSTTHIIKRDLEYSEPYDARKLYASIYAICLSLRESTAEAELVAGKVVRDTEEWLEDKHEITSHDLRHHAADFLKRYSPDAAYLFLHHRNLGR